jgi:hypothetical protein
VIGELGPYPEYKESELPGLDGSRLPARFGVAPVDGLVSPAYVVDVVGKPWGPKTAIG